MAQNLEDHLDQSATDSIVGTLGQVLRALLVAYEVDFDQAEITGIEVVLSDEGHGQDLEERTWCLVYDTSGSPHWQRC